MKREDFGIIILVGMFVCLLIFCYAITYQERMDWGRGTCLEYKITQTEEGYMPLSLNTTAGYKKMKECGLIKL